MLTDIAEGIKIFIEYLCQEFSPLWIKFVFFITLPVGQGNILTSLTMLKVQRSRLCCFVFHDVFIISR